MQRTAWRLSVCRLVGPFVSQDILVAHGCKSLSVINAHLQGHTVLSSRLFPQLSALERLRRSAGSTANIPINIADGGSGLHLQLPLALPFFPSPFLTETVKNFASRAASVQWDIDAAQLPALDTPTEDEKALVSSLTFSRAHAVSVRCTALPPNTPSPDPALLRHLSPDSCPLARQLSVFGGKGCVAAVHLAKAMPQMDILCVEGVSTPAEEEMLRGLLKATGTERSLSRVEVGMVGLGDGGLQWGEERERDLLPKISQLDVRVFVPNAAAVDLPGTIVRSVESLIKLQGLRCVTWTLRDVPSALTDGLCAALLQEVASRLAGGGLLGGFHIDAVAGHGLVTVTAEKTGGRSVGAAGVTGWMCFPSLLMIACGRVLYTVLRQTF